MNQTKNQIIIDFMIVSII